MAADDEGAKPTASLKEERATVSDPAPVIIDTDIGEDIDDLWALCLALESPELDVQLVTTGFGNADAKADIVAKTLDELGRTDVPIGIGISTGNWPPHYGDWTAGFDRDAYEGEIYDNGVEKLLETVIRDDTDRMRLSLVVRSLDNDGSKSLSSRGKDGETR